MEYFQRTTVVGCLVRSVKSCVQPTIVGIENVGSDGKGKKYPHVADLYEMLCIYLYPSEINIDHSPIGPYFNVSYNSSLKRNQYCVHISLATYFRSKRHDVQIAYRNRA